MTHFKKAKWIWLGGETGKSTAKTRPTLFAPARDNAVTAHFYKTVALAEDTLTRLRISADVFYLLFVNGKFIDRGPAESGGDYGLCDPLPWRFFDEHHLLLAKGKNEIEIYVSNTPHVQADVSSGRAGLIAEGEADDGRILFFTDESFRAASNSPYDEVLRSFVAPKKINVGSMLSEKTAAVEITEQMPDPIPSGLPPMHTESLSYVRELYGDETRFDFGRIRPAYLSLSVTAEQDATFTVRLYEVTGKPCHHTLSLRVEKGTHHFFSYQLHSFRYLSVVLPVGVSITPTAILSHYPRPEPYSFSCDDAAINKIYEVSAATLPSCMQKYHMDSPIHQELLGCTGDYLIQSRINETTVGETALTRLDLLRTAWMLERTNGKLFHTAYSLMFPMWLCDYYDFSGDTATLAACEAACDAILSRFDGYAEDGLLTHTPNYLFIDWVCVGDYTLHHPPRNLGETIMNCFWYHARECVARVKRILGRDDEADGIVAGLTDFRRCFDQAFYDDRRGLYFAGRPCDTGNGGWRPAADGKRYFGIHENACAALWILPKEEGRALLMRALSDPSLIPAQSYFLHFVLEALDRVGLFKEYAREILYRWLPAIEECDTSLKETLIECGFDPDYSHAWGATPAYHLPRICLGVRHEDGIPCLTSPVLPDGIDFAEGILPFGNGRLHVTVVREKDGSLTRTTKELS